ncbi:hypothetical protein E3N88_43830 [Mikania micrantha]|uniref:DYW domain-containing protein n=1 Tax=Mikania micrantha TaxID=192012 RepID=A0A5N6LDS5_9ASTR|nr:hypothetical protein E3N88_43830 [Mikania micrantha]
MEEVRAYDRVARSRRLVVVGVVVAGGCQWWWWLEVGGGGVCWRWWLPTVAGGRFLCSRCKRIHGQRRIEGRGAILCGGCPRRRLRLWPLEKMSGVGERGYDLEEERVASLIRKCPNMRVLGQIHSHILTRPLPFSTLCFSLSKIICFCALSPMGNILYAQKLLLQNPKPNIFSWNSLIRGFSQYHTSPTTQSFSVFKRLISAGHPNPNTYTLAFVLKSCSMLPAVVEGRQVHSRVIRSGFWSNSFLQSSLVNFYAKCEEIESARKVFDEMPDISMIVWSAMIGGYAKLGLFNEALGLFGDMQKAGVVPDEVTMASVVSACAGLGALDVGSWVHAYIMKRKIMIDTTLSTALINMYAKCGCIEKAKEVFDEMPTKDSRAWSSMIVGFAIHGLPEDALSIFASMEESKLVPEGQKHWASLLQSGIQPSKEHYSCMVDLFCRANLLQEANTFIKNMPIDPDPVILRTFLAACKKNKNMEKGESVAQQLLELEPFKAENYALLSSLYAACSQWSLGHKTNVSGVLHDVGDEVKQEALCEHSERLAIAYGMLKTKAPVVIRIVKNLRVCEDCHEVTKIISKEYEREIIVRDRVRFHKFVGGSCSCNDIW